MDYDVYVTFRVFSMLRCTELECAMTGAGGSVKRVRGQPGLSVWLVESALPPDAEVEMHLVSLLDGLEPHAQLIAGIDATERSFLCTIASGESAVNATLSPRVLERVASLDAEIHVSVWAQLYGDEEDEDSESSKPPPESS